LFAGTGSSSARVTAAVTASSAGTRGSKTTVTVSDAPAPRVAMSQVRVVVPVQVAPGAVLETKSTPAGRLMVSSMPLAGS
jgi:hypothetical protein